MEQNKTPFKVRYCKPVCDGLVGRGRDFVCARERGRVSFRCRDNTLFARTLIYDSSARKIVYTVLGFALNVTISKQCCYHE